MGRRFLKHGAPRLLQYSNGREGYAYRKAYADLAATLGPFDSELVKFEAGRVAMARLQYEAATLALSTAQRARRVGKGRRPNAQLIERLARRQGLADGTYQAAAVRLEALVSRNGHASSSRASSPEALTVQARQALAEQASRPA